MEAVELEPVGNDRVVMRPDGANVITDGIEDGRLAGQRADTPTTEHVVLKERVPHTAGAVAGEDAAPEHLAGVGGPGFGRTAAAVQGQGHHARVGQPEVAIEAPSEVRCLASQLLGLVVV